MATALKNLTKMGTDVKQIARLLQKKAPPGHMLAYISPEEAEVLKQRGGSGRITNEGIPSFEPIDVSGANTLGFDQPVQTGQQVQPDIGPTSTATGGGDTISAAPLADIQPFSPGVSTFGQGQPLGTGQYDTTPISQPFTTTGAPGTQGLLGTGTAGIQPIQEEVAPLPTRDTTQVPLGPEPKGFFEGMSDQTKARLGISGLETLLGASTARAARAQGQAAKEALQAQAAPYQQQGQQLLAASQRGELTPANQQILQAAQAQAAQNIATRGGVGGMQAQNQINALQQQLLTNQLNLGLQLQSVGDKIAQGAIQAGVQADQYVNNLTSSYALNIARTLAGGLPGGTTTTPTPQP
jgi:hypothetical protein